MNPRSKSERPLKAKLREAARSEILASAERVVGTRGISSTKMEEVALGAGVSVGTLYNYFADKDSLLTALLDERRAELIQALDVELARDAERPFKVQLQSFLSITLNHLARHERLFQTMIEEDARSGKARRGKPALRELSQRCNTLILRGQQQKALLADDPHVLTAFLMGAIRGLMGQAFFGEGIELEKAESLSISMTKLFLEGAGRK